MSDTTTAPASTAGAPAAIVLARHLVALAFAVLPACYLAGGISLRAWLGMYLMCVIAGALVAGALALFLTAKQAAKSTRNFVVTLWVFAALGTLGGWAAHEQDKAEAAARSAPNPFANPNFGK